MFFFFYFLFTHGLPKYLSENPIESLQYRTRKPLSSATVLCSAVMTVRIRNYTRPLVNLTVNPISFFKSKSASDVVSSGNFRPLSLARKKSYVFRKNSRAFSTFFPQCLSFGSLAKKVMFGDR